MPNILFINTFAPPPFTGGAEYSMLADAKMLSAAGYDVTVAGLVPRGTPASEYSEAGVRFVRLATVLRYWPWTHPRPRFSFPARLLWQGLDLINWTARGRVNRLFNLDTFDLVITNNLRGWTTAPWSAARDRGIPIIHQVRDYGLICLKSTLYRKNANCTDTCAGCKLRSMRTSQSAQPDVVATVSKAVFAEHVARGIFRKSRMFINAPRVEPIYGNADVERTIPFAYIGRVGVEKGLDTIGEAIRDSPYEVVVAGEVTDRERELLSREYPGLKFVGVVKASEFLSMVHNIIVPSKWKEPFGRVVVEAGRAGARVLISDQPGLLEAARSIGLNASIFPAGDAPRLRALMDEVANKPAEALRVIPVGPDKRSLLDAVDNLLNGVRLTRWEQ